MNHQEYGIIYLKNEGYRIINWSRKLHHSVIGNTRFSSEIYSFNSMKEMFDSWKKRWTIKFKSKVQIAEIMLIYKFAN